MKRVLSRRSASRVKRHRNIKLLVQMVSKKVVTHIQNKKSLLMVGFRLEIKSRSHSDGLRDLLNTAGGLELGGGGGVVRPQGVQRKALGQAVKKFDQV